MTTKMTRTQIELDKYGDVIIASASRRNPGERIQIYWDTNWNSLIGEAVVVGDATEAEFLARGKGPTGKYWPYFHRVVAE